MSILDLHADEMETAALNTRRDPYVAPRRSAWGGILTAAPRGAFRAAAEVGASLADIGGAVAAFRDTPSREMERGGLPASAFSSDLGDSVRSYWDSLKPDPETASTAEQVLFGFSRGLAKLVPATIAAGPAGAIAVGIEEAMTVSDDLRRQGVQDGPRQLAGIIQGTGMASAALPLLGRTLAETAALYVAGGPGGFMAQQALTRKVLENAGQERIAGNYDPFDPIGLTVAAAIPLVFTAAGLRGQKLRAEAKAQADFIAGPRPSEPTPVAAAVAEAVRAPELSPEVVDAAMVNHLRVAGEVTRVAGVIPRADSLSAADRAIEDRFARALSGNFTQAAEQYAAVKGTRGGRVLNTDLARELSPDYLAQRTRSAAVHEPASWFIKQLYAQRLAQLSPGDVVAFSSGGTGAGKTTALDDLHLADDAAIVYDTNMNTLGSAVAKIDQALEAGAAVRIFHVQRDPVEALVKGALPRAMRQEAEFGTGRTVPLVEHARTHRGAAEVIQQLAEKYKGDERVKITVIDNTRGKGGAAVADLNFVRRFDYNGAEGRLYEALKQARDDGRISGDVFRATQGDESGRVPPALVTSSRGQPEPQRASGSAGRRETSDPLERLNEPAGAPPKPLAPPIPDTIAARVADLESTMPDLIVRVDPDGRHVTLAEDLAEVRRLAAEGSDDALGTLDADLLQVAVNCALSSGG